MNHQMHPNSLANLKPHRFRKGHDPSRRIGARSAGATIREWWNILCEEDDDGNALYDDDELRRIADDPKDSHTKRLAAREILQAHEEGLTKFGKRLGSDSLDRIMDRTEGKPVQTLHIEKEEIPTPDEAENNLVRYFREHPEMLENSHTQLLLLRLGRESVSLREKLSPVLEQHCPELLVAIEPITVVASEPDSPAGPA